MKCLRCGYCCIKYMVIIVDDPAKGMSDDNLIAKASDEWCKHLVGNKPGEYSCAIHNYPWYKQTPCYQYGQVELSVEDPCRTGKWMLDHPNYHHILTRGQMNKVMMEEWHILSLDVWGNEKDGWEVNQAFKVNEIFIPDNFVGADIVPMLRRCQMLSDDHLDKDYEVRWDSEGFIELYREYDQRPLLHIQKVHDGHSYEQ